MRKTNLIIYLLFSQFLISQEVMFSHSELSSSRFNPALTGEFVGSYRLSSIYRSLNDNFAQTPSFQFDYNLGVKNSQDWLGVGLSITQDKLGKVVQFERTHMAFSTAYHKDLDGTQNKVLTLGFSSGLIFESLNLNAEVRTEETILRQSGSGPISGLFQGGNTQYFKNALGISYKHGFGEQSFILGGASYHFYNRLKKSTANKTQWPYGLTAYLTAGMSFGENFIIRPKVFYAQLDQKLQQFQYYSALPFYFILTEGSFQLGIGPSFRSQNNWGGLVHVQFDQFEIGYQYESGSVLFPPSHEIMFTLRGNISKDTKYEPTLFCPRY